MSKKPEAKIVTQRNQDGTTEIFTVDANNSNRQVRTGLVANSNRDTEAKVKYIKECFEKNGSRVSFHDC